MTARFARPALAVAALTLAPLAPARADNLDIGLMKNIYEINNYLSEHKIETVGALNFRVQKGAGKESFSIGSLCGGMPLRVETALVVTNHPVKPRKIIHDASGAVAGFKIDWYSKPTERPQLFARTYPLAWGLTKAKPDALLTGLIKVSPDLSKLTVRVEAIKESDPKKLDKVCEFEVDNDRDLLRELGQSYSVSRSINKTTVAARNKEAVRNAHSRDLNEIPAGDLTPDNIKGLKFEVLYNEVPQVPHKDENSPGEWRIDNPSEGTKICFRVQHNGTVGERLGASIRVNGRSVWNQAEGPIDASTGVWIFDPGQLPTEFRGFFTDVKGTNLLPFNVLSEEESLARSAEFGERVGTIDIDVLASQPAGSGGEDDHEVLSISRGLSRSIKPGTKLKTPEDLRKELLAKNAILKKAAVAASKGSRGLIDAGAEAVTGPEVQSAELPDRKPVGRLTIRYYDPKTSAALQVSK